VNEQLIGDLMIELAPAGNDNEYFLSLAQRITNCAIAADEIDTAKL
jgi:hypothetical protein